MEPEELKVEEVTEDEVLLYVSRYENGYLSVMAKLPENTFIPTHDEVYKVRIPKKLPPQKNYCKGKII